VKWEGEPVTPRGTNPQATLVWAGERALVLNEKGELVLAALSPEGFRGLGKASLLTGQVWAHPAYAGGCVFARSDEEVVCVPPGKMKEAPSGSRPRESARRSVRRWVRSPGQPRARLWRTTRSVRILASA
jgi:hypothetical protein